MTEHPESLTNERELDELDDLDESLAPRLGEIDLSRLASPVVVRAAAGIVIATMVLVWPERTDTILARLIGIAVVVMAATEMWAALMRKPPQRFEAAVASLVMVAGSLLLIWPQRSETVLGRLIGAALALVAVRDLVSLRRIEGDEPRAWIVSRSMALLGTGALVALFPSEIFATATTIIALGWIALSLIVIVITIDTRTTEAPDYAQATELVAEWLMDRPKSVDDRQSLYDKILYEGPLAQRRVVRFITLMSFASIIASMGVITDSTAVVIGAMLIAPLMTPLMGMAISLVMGWPNRLGRSALVALAGIALAIGIGVILGLAVPTVIDTANNAQILARSSPTTLDLIIALAAGSAGAYGLSRPDVSDSLPGVAIAISLVPPLSVVGIAYSQGDFASGNGALLLFATNAIAILIMGGLTFIFTGVTPIQRATSNQHRVRTWLATIATLAALVFGSLLLNGAEIASDALRQSSVETTVDEWLTDHPDHVLLRLDVNGDTVTATVAGPTNGAPTAASLVDDLAAALDRDVTVDLRLTVQERDVASSSDG